MLHGRKRARYALHFSLSLSSTPLSPSFPSLFLSLFFSRDPSLFRFLFSFCRYSLSVTFRALRSGRTRSVVRGVTHVRGSCARVLVPINRVRGLHFFSSTTSGPPRRNVRRNENRSAVTSMKKKKKKVKMIGAPGRVTAFRRRPRRREDAPRAAVDADLRIVDVAPISLRRDSWNACLS